MNGSSGAQSAKSTISPMHMYNDMTLGGVVTRQEAAHLWGKSLSGIDSACLRGKLHFRKALSGGTILITVQSLVDLWGIPDEYTLWECFVGPVDMTTQDAFSVASRMKGTLLDGNQTE